MCKTVIQKYGREGRKIKRFELTSKLLRMTRGYIKFARSEQIFYINKSEEIRIRAINYAYKQVTRIVKRIRDRIDHF